ncbi:LTA synthase family protein [Alloiococcus sp. CFN-8]|uniref:LTA synthase family protein n=1 Tax=Alloiococcus sp. CFN-8 TaxID=3416081 RepID=UPI003CEF7F33
MRTILYKYIIFLLYPICFLGKEIIVFNDRDISFDSSRVIFTLLIYIGLLSWTLLFSVKRQAFVLLLLDILISVLYLADMIYQRYYYQYLTVELIPMIMVDQKELGDSIIRLLQPADFWIFASIPLGIIIYFMVRRLKERKIKIRFERGINLAIVIFLFLTMTMIYDSKTEEHKDVLIHTWEIKGIADNLGLPYYHYHDIKKMTINKWNKGNLSEDNLQYIRDYFNENNDLEVSTSLMIEDKDLHGVASGRNVIMVQVEALQEFVVNLLVAGEEVTPNLNRMAREGLHFSNVYAQTAGGNTSDAEFMANNSLYGAATGAAYFSFVNNEYNALPKVLKNNGYTSAFAMHAGSKTYWNRNVAYNSFDFDKFYYNEYYSTDKVVGWGINDRDFFVENVQYLKEYAKPFYSFMVTVSSHFPFGYFKWDSRVALEDKYEETQLDSYLEDIAFVDMAIGDFLEELKVNNLHDNSILVFYGDHRGLKDDMNEVLTEFLDIENSPVSVIGELTKIPFIVYAPGITLQKEVTTIGGQIDIMPTVLNLLGIDNDYMVGRDLVNTKEDLSVLRNGSFITSDIIYDGDTDIAYHRETGELLVKEVINKELSEAIKKLEVSDMILKYNALEFLINSSKN